MKGVADFFLYQSYRSALFFLFSVLPVCLFSVYISIYLLFSFLQKKRYALFITGIVGLVIFNCITALFFYGIIRPYICPDCDAINLREEINIIGNNGINIASIMALVGLGIKFTKSWYLQQVQNRILARQKITSELKLLKARIQPGFLFESLQVLYDKISSDKNLAAEMLLKFSDLLSYMLYECDDDFVLIQRELIIMEEFIALEKIMQGTKLKIETNITGEISGNYIPSFILLPLVQNCVIALHDDLQKEPHYIEMKIHTENNIICFEMNIQPADTITLRDIYPAIIHTIINRLETVYINNYELKSFEEEGKFIVLMSLLLADFLPLKQTQATEKGYSYAHV